MKYWYLIAILLTVLTIDANAQTVNPNASPELQAVQSKLQEEYSQNLQLRTALIKEQLKTKELEIKIKELTK